LILRRVRAETGSVRTVLELIVVILLPTGLGYALLGGVRALRWFSGSRLSRRRPPPVAGAPLERLGARLRRLRAQLDATENQMATPAKGLRLRALRAAYADVLREACERFGVSAPPADADGRIPLAEIYRAEAALRHRGLDVREPAAR
jgi:hypothetical protein